MVAPKLLSVEEYLELEKTSEVRHEYVDGELIAMAGEKRRHNRLALRFVILLEDALQKRQCELVVEGVKLRTRTTRFRYPDVMISCAPGDDEYFLDNPCFIAEILSDTTAHTDLTKKLDEYKKLPTLERYALVSQSSPFVILYKRVSEHWEVETLDGEGEIDIPCLETKMTLEQLYQGISFETATKEQKAES
jgi:Uma2 family endonuclease